MRFLIIFFSFLVTGCVSMQQERINAALADLQQKTEDCRQQRVSGSLNYVQAAECMNNHIAATYSTLGYRHMDLLHVVNAHRVSIAERLDKGEITVPQATQQLAEVSSKATSEANNREVAQQRSSAEMGLLGIQLMNASGPRTLGGQQICNTRNMGGMWQTVCQ